MNHTELTKYLNDFAGNLCEVQRSDPARAAEIIINSCNQIRIVDWSQIKTIPEAEKAADRVREFFGTIFSDIVFFVTYVHTIGFERVKANTNLAIAINAYCGPRISSLFLGGQKFSNTNGLLDKEILTKFIELSNEHKKQQDALLVLFQSPAKS